MELVPERDLIRPGGMDVPIGAEKKHRIPEKMLTLIDSLGELTKCIEALESRISPVLTRQPEPKETGAVVQAGYAPDASPESPLSDHIGGAANLINREIMRIKAIIRRADF